VDPEHPPLLRLWAALPLVVAGQPPPDTAAIDRSTPEEWTSGRLFAYSHDVLYADPYADRRLYAARAMVVAIGVLLGVLLFLWARDWLGFGAACAAAAMYVVEPNLLAHATLVTTDLAVAAAMFAAIYFLWRLHRFGGAANTAAFVLTFAAALVTKFSALELIPIAAVLLAVMAFSGSLRWRDAAAIAAMLAVATLTTIWAVYGFRYAPSAAADWLYHAHDDPIVLQRLPRPAAVVRWIDAHHLLPNAYSEGLLLSQAKAQVREAFLMGEISQTGWWYYFPIAFLLKTPVALLLASALGGAILIVRRRILGVADVAFVAVPVMVIAGVAIATPLNIGLRHLLPLYPFVILAAAAAARELLPRREGRAALALLAILWLAEFGRVYPHTLAFFNVFAGGPANGDRFLVDSNIDWGQDLKPLKRWMDASGVERIGLAYFGTADASYYDINYAPLPGSGFFADTPSAPLTFPGHVAVSVTLLHGVYLDDRLREFYAPLRQMTPIARIGYSINVYRVDQPWWR
jgi:hypothetical protein